MSAPQFEQPPLRTRNTEGGGSSYQHPATGEKVPSVTTISGMIDKSSFLTPWAAKLAAQWVSQNMDRLVNLTDPDIVFEMVKKGAADLRHEGRDLGSLAHNTIEMLLDAILAGQDLSTVVVPEAVQHHITGWFEFITRWQVDAFVLIEETVWSHQHKYAGTLDAVVHSKVAGNILVDWKTGKSVYADSAMQLTALARADCLVSPDGERPMPQVDAAGIVHLPAPQLTPTGRPSVRGSWSYRPIPMREVDWETFLHLRAVYDWEKLHAKDALGGKQTTPA